jgi:hypothetical protein
MSRAALERRLARLEAAVARVVRQAAAPDFGVAEMPRHLSFNEIVRAQRVAAQYGSPEAALERGDPTFVALLAVAAARYAGETVADLYSEAT